MPQQLLSGRWRARQATGPRGTAQPSGWSGGSAGDLARLEALAAAAAGRLESPAAAARRRSRDRVRWAAAAAAAAAVALVLVVRSFGGTCAPIYTFEEPVAAGSGVDAALPTAGWRPDADRCA